MKKILLLVSLFCTVTLAHADWTQLNHADNSLTLYVDLETRKDSGHGTVMLWHLVDYQSQQSYEGKAFYSVKGQDEFNCAQGVSREMMYLWHRDKMGNSQVVQSTYVPTAWLSPEAGTIKQALMHIACTAK